MSLKRSFIIRLRSLVEHLEISTLISTRFVSDVKNLRQFRQFKKILVLLTV